MQYMDVITDGDLSIGRIDVALNCVRVTWYENSGNENILLSKHYGLVTADSIRGLLNVVPMETW